MFLCGCGVRACDVVHACAMAMCLWLFVLLVQCAARLLYVSYLCPFVRFLCRYDILRLFGFVCSKSRQEFLQSYTNFYVYLYINSYQ